ncbi:MAG TPA: PIN domain-containing protein [Polyangiaceae bacterium]|nr:PIN domain-containing protein [Polyangiaceae bacterium]
MAYLLDAGTLVEVLRAVPSRTLVRRLTGVPSRDRWTSSIAVSQILVAARRTGSQRLMKDVIRLVAAIKVASFDMLSAQAFAKLRATVAPEVDTDDVMSAAIAVTNDFTLVTRRPSDFARYPGLRVEDWTA